MSILAQCPACHTKQSVRNKVCKCDMNLDAAKRSGKVRYWIRYYLPGKIQRTEPVGFSIEEARDEEAEKRGFKRSGDLTAASIGEITFEQLAKWYLSQEVVKSLASFEEIKSKVKKFNRIFGKTQVNKIKAIDLKNYQARLLKKGLAQGTVDHCLGKIKTMVNIAFENDIIGAAPYKAFKQVKKTLVKGSDVRDRVLSKKEYQALIKHAGGHTAGIITMAYNTGMRKSEILSLTWRKIDLKKRMIYLKAEDTKDGEPRKVPIGPEL